MYPINDRDYLKICSQIASLMSISLSASKKKVEIQIAKKGSKTIVEKKEVAAQVLEFCKNEKNNGVDSVGIFNELMESLVNDDNFMVED